MFFENFEWSKTKAFLTRSTYIFCILGEFCCRPQTLTTLRAAFCLDEYRMSFTVCLPEENRTHLCHDLSLPHYTCTCNTTIHYMAPRSDIKEIKSTSSLHNIRFCFHIWRKNEYHWLKHVAKLQESGEPQRKKISFCRKSKAVGWVPLEYMMRQGPCPSRVRPPSRSAVAVGIGISALPLPFPLRKYNFTGETRVPARPCLPPSFLPSCS